VRALVIGGECAAAMERVSDTWKTNLAQGARPLAYRLSDEMVSTSLRAAYAVGADYCGVDLMLGEDGLVYLIEVNSMPAWEGLQSVCSADLAERLVDFLLAELG
jgi:glutathione synthase/RimK-type ligase-like ATP-grasp enzyme